MQSDHLSTFIKIMEEGFAKANLQVIDQFVSDHFSEHQFGAAAGKEGLKQTITQLHSGLSNLQYVLQHAVQEGDMVWAHFGATATQSGAFMHMPPSGKQISIDVMDVARFENGLMVEHWGVPDRFAAMMQLGAFDKK